MLTDDCKVRLRVNAGSPVGTTFRTKSKAPFLMYLCAYLQYDGDDDFIKIVLHAEAPLE